MVPKDQFVQVSDVEHLTICRIKSSVCSSRGEGGRVGIRYLPT